MITRQYSLEQMPDYPLNRDFNWNKIVFFDIETTGFAAESSYLYLIGCSFYKDSTFHLIQWFSESIKEEVLLLTSFFKFLQNYEVLIHYNGTGFDIPYLQNKLSILKLNYSFEGVYSIDIYKKIIPYKKLLNINSLRLKSIENYLNIRREDTFDGGDLIQVYQSYLGRKQYELLWNTRNPEHSLPMPPQADFLLNQLLLHNADDIRGLLSICPILNYIDLFERPIRILQASVEGVFLTIRFEISANLPVRVNYGNDLVRLTALSNNALLSIQVYEGELKYFYDNYKDYYYLPAEDYAIHKSVASFVDKEHRIKAKPSTCYTKKQGTFAPQYESIITPCFKINHQDKLSFLEIHTDFLLQEENLELYVKHLLSHLISKN